VVYTDPAAPLPPATEACRFAVAHSGALDAAVPAPDDGAPAVAAPAAGDASAVAPAVAAPGAGDAPVEAAVAPDTDDGAELTELDELDELHPAASSAAAASAAAVSGTRRDRAVTVMG
jgi:hypothetical protein